MYIPNSVLSTGHGVFEMYDGQWTMVRPCCAADWCGVIDVGGNRIRRSCPFTPAYMSAFCSSCKKNLITTTSPSALDPNLRVDFINELYKLKYLKPEQYFIEAILDTKIDANKTFVKVLAELQFLECNEHYYRKYFLGYSMVVSPSIFWYNTKSPGNSNVFVTSMINESIFLQKLFIV